MRFGRRKANVWKNIRFDERTDGFYKKLRKETGKKMKKKYERAECKILEMNEADVLRTSDNTDPYLDDGIWTELY